MPSAHRRRTWLVAAAAALATGCGGGEQASATCATAPATAPPTAPAATAGAVTARADRGLVDHGQSVRITLTVTGPITYDAPCTAPVSLIVADSSDLHVFTSAPPAPRGSRCGAVTLSAGEAASYDLDWVPDPSLPAGSYRGLVSLGAGEPLLLPVVLGRPRAACRR